jgi:hypothetical protein
LDIYIDNAAVVNTWAKDTRNAVIKRQETPGNAIWNRIQQLGANRTGRTDVHKVHSHVAGKGKSSNSRKAGYLACACGEEPCDPMHKHHEGNDFADTEAKNGAMARESAHQLEIQDGEEDYHLERKGKPVQRKLSAALKEARDEKVREEMMVSEKSTLKRAGVALEMSSRMVRGACSRNKTVGLTFPARALTDQLPTYKREFKRVEAGEGSYRDRFGDKIEGGLCQYCKSIGTVAVEDIEHIMNKCKRQSMVDIRVAAKQKILELWGKAATDRAAWLMCDPTEVGPEGWQGAWGWLGLVPSHTRDVNPEGRGRCKMWTKAGLILAEGGYALWNDRNDWVVEWEKENGVRPDWGAHKGSTGKRKATGDRPMGKKKMADLKKESARSQMARDLAVATVPMKNNPADDSSNPAKPRVRHAKKKKASFKLSVRTACARADERGRELREELGEMLDNRKCGYKGCRRYPTKVAWGCSGPEGNGEPEPRCEEHESIPCRGGMVGCACRVTEEEDVPKQKKK